MTLPVEKRRYTIQEYLKLEETATDRHEFHNGEILAMSGGSFRHNRICSNLQFLLNDRLEGKKCLPLGDNMRVRIPGQDRYVYPDASVVCESPQFDIDDTNQSTIISPTVIIEVLSDSTEAYDRGAKFSFYRQIPALEEYVLIAQHEHAIQSFLRQPDGTWLFNTWSGLASIAFLKSIKIDLPLAKVYSRVDLENPAERSETA